MTLKEVFKDAVFIKALTYGRVRDTKSVATKVKCSYEEAKLRLLELMVDGKVIGVQERHSGREGFKWMWKLNKNYVEPNLTPRCDGLHLWDRGLVYNKYTFIQFARTCAKIAELSGVTLMNMEAAAYKPEFSENRVCFNGDSANDGEDYPFCINRAIVDTSKHMKGEKGRYYDYCDTGNKQYDVVVVACLIALKQYFVKTTLSLGADRKTIEAAVALVENAGVSVNVRKLQYRVESQAVADRDIIINKFVAWLEKK